jgi:hypothetical protein
VKWQTQPRNTTNDTGFYTTTDAGGPGTSIDLSNGGAGTFMTVGAAVRFGNASTVAGSTQLDWRVVNSVINNGIATDEESLTNTGPV